MSNITKFSFYGNEIAFAKGKRAVMVNATEMAKPFGKEIKHWGENSSTTEFVVCLAKARGIEPNPQFANLLKINEVGNISSLNISDLAKVFPSLVYVVKGGLEKQGTWLHEDVALVFAQWLSPEFYLWCNDRIKELLTSGVATIANDDEAILHAMQVLQKRVEESKAKQRELVAANSQLMANNASLAHTNIQLATDIKDNAPKVSFANAVADSDNCILIREFAKILQQNGIQMGERKLFQWLRCNGYLLTHGDSYNLPSQRSMEMDLLRIKKTTIQNPDGKVKVTTTAKMTGKGQIYFLDKLKKAA